MAIREEAQKNHDEFIACHAVNEYRVMLGGALDFASRPWRSRRSSIRRCRTSAWGKVFDFIHVTNGVLRSRGIELPLERQSTTNHDTRFDKGMEVQKRIFGDRIDQMYAQSPKDQIHLQTYLSANCLGDYDTRTGLDLKTREFLTFSMLAALGGCEPQLAGHVAGNVAVGNDRQVLICAITHLLPFIGYPRTLNAFRGIHEETSK